MGLQWRGKKPRINDSHEFKPLLVEIEEEPRHPLGPVIFWLVIVTIFFFAVWTYAGRVDVVVTARGRLIPVGEVKVLQPLATGVVKGILVKEGDFVQKDQVLMEIDPTDTKSELTSMRADFTQLSLEIERLQATLDSTPFQPDPELYDAQVLAVQRRIYFSNLERLSRQIKIKEEDLRKVEEERGAMRKNLVQSRYLLAMSSDKAARLESVKDIVSREEVAQAETEVKKYHNEILLAGHREAVLLTDQERVRKEIRLLEEESRNALLAELAEKRQKYLYLQANIEKMTYFNAHQQIVAPMDGHINKIFIHTEGGVVTPAERLLTLVPANSPLVVKALVENKDIGFVEAGMAAAIKVDTFSFQKYGILGGLVAQVGKDSVEDEKLGLIYEVQVTPLKTSMMIEGIDTPINAGMSVTAEIKVGRRRIIEFFIYPLIKSLYEGMSVR